ncbi:ATP-binding protein [Rhizobium sp. FY34]|uniref:ATP-binding protein n=1 Tax=Rhizobium sp. FY34 TaxID=2562309 RepID=UPI0010BF8CC3|nr:ATP-binding protein [Rhizobium sp. FY34]
MTAQDKDLQSCEQEPIRVPGAIQPHGGLFVLRSADMCVLQVSKNLSDYLGQSIALGAAPSGEIADLLPALSQWYASAQPFYFTVLEDRRLSLVAHRSGLLIVVEVEELGDQSLDDIFLGLRSFTQRLSSEAGLRGCLRAAAEFVHDLTGFDRVLVYRFDAEWNGQVIEEAGNGHLPSYRDLRFPSTDIPAQARALYASNRLRIIANANYIPVPVYPADNPDTGQPLDMSFAQLRSVSPVHLEYMRNMGTAASMSVSIMVGGRLWGLIACHSCDPHLVSYTVRETCDLAVQSLAMAIFGLERAEEAARRFALGQVTTVLLAGMSASSDWVEGLVAMEGALLSLVGAKGAVVVTEHVFRSIGETPVEAEVLSLIAWLETFAGQDLFATSELASLYPAASSFAATGSGVLAVRISELHANWLIWFRPELPRTVQWGGDPHKYVQESGRIHPRRSFDAWQEMVRMQSAPWQEAEQAAAHDLRTAIVGVVLRKAEELAELTRELQRSNKELEAFSYSVSHDLRAPFRHIVGFSQLLRDREVALDEKSQHYLQTISEAALAAGKLVDDLLNFSQLGRQVLMPKPVDMDKLVAEVIRSMRLAMEGRDIEWSVEPLPVAWGDATLLRQVWYNLIDNAVKYTAPRRPARISISGEVRGDRLLYRVKDNGVGFDMAYVSKLFGVFQRLQRAEDFDGTGIGLALSRRIVERHNGTIAAEGAVDGGACFTFVLPATERKDRAFA